MHQSLKATTMLKRTLLLTVINFFMLPSKLMLSSSTEISIISLTASERKEVIQNLIGRDISLITLTPLQRLAIIQEQELRARGLPPFSDSTISEAQSQELKDNKTISQADHKMQLVTTGEIKRSVDCSSSQNSKILF